MRKYQQNLLKIDSKTIEKIEKILDSGHDEFLKEDQATQQISFDLWCNNIIAENHRAQALAYEQAAHIDGDWKVLVI